MKHTNYKFEDGEWWYYGQADGRRRLKSHQKKNKTRMFVGAKYVTKSAPYHKPGNYSTTADVAFSEIEDKIPNKNEGHIYIVSNKAWKGWYKIGSALDATDRLKQFQTSSPFRDYKLEYKIKSKNRMYVEKEIHSRLKEKHEKRNEWFKMDKDKAKRYIREAVNADKQRKVIPDEKT
jgi:hypothetical protein